MKAAAPDLANGDVAFDFVLVGRVATYAIAYAEARRRKGNVERELRDFDDQDGGADARRTRPLGDATHAEFVAGKRARLTDAMMRHGRHQHDACLSAAGLLAKARGSAAAQAAATAWGHITGEAGIAAIEVCVNALLDDQGGTGG